MFCLLIHTLVKTALCENVPMFAFIIVIKQVDFRSFYNNKSVKESEGQTFFLSGEHPQYKPKHLDEIYN